jgi:hypothetical protein
MNQTQPSFSQINSHISGEFSKIPVSLQRLEPSSITTEKNFADLSGLLHDDLTEKINYQM